MINLIKYLYNIKDEDKKKIRYFLGVDSDEELIAEAHQEGVDIGKDEKTQIIRSYKYYAKQYNATEKYFRKQEKKINIEKEKDNDKEMDNDKEINNNKVKNKVKNKGERDEVFIQQTLFKYNKNKQYKELIKIFGSDAENGIELLDNKLTIINDINLIIKKASLFKADCIIKMKKTKKIYYSSIKSLRGSPPSIINTTRREYFCSNENLFPYLISMDILVSQYLKEQDNINENKSEVDRFLHDYEITDSQKKDIIFIIKWFMFNGTGTGPSLIKADSIIEFDNNKNIKFILCNTEEAKIKYISDNWKKFNISLRGHKIQKNGKIRGNGIRLNGPCDKDKKWLCYYYDNGKKLPRGALNIRLC